MPELLLDVAPEVGGEPLCPSAFEFEPGLAA